MAGATTTYKVDIVYDLKGGATKGLREMRTETAKVASGLGGIKSMLGILAGGFAIHGAKHFLVDFNSEIQRMKIGLATVTAMNLKIPFEQAQRAADRLMVDFQKMSMESPNTTREFVEMANLISSSVLHAGMGLKDLETMTKGAITASNALNVRPDLMAREIQRMLAGTVIIRDHAAKQLLASVGIFDFHQFNKKTASERAGITQQAFNSKDIQAAAKAYKDTFAGVTSTLKDNLEIGLGKVGMPLLQAMTGEIKSWLGWVEKNPQMIADMVSKLGGGLKEGFTIVKSIASEVVPVFMSAMGMIKDVFEFVSQHRDVLIQTAKALLIFKGVGMVGGMARGIGGGVGGLFGEMTTGLKGLVDGLKGAGGATSLGGLFMSLGGALTGLLGAAGPIAMFGIALYALHGIITRETEDEKKRREHAEAVNRTAGDFLKQIEDKKELEDRKKHLGLSDDDPYGGINEKLKALQLSKDQLIDLGIKEGMIRETINPGVSRRMVLTTGGGMDLSHSPALGALSQALFELFKDEAEKERGMFRGVGMPAMAGMFGGANGIGGQLGFIEHALGSVAKEKDAFDIPGAKAADVKVTINKIEVYSDDPDRFVAQAVQSFEDITRNPTQAHEILRGAF